MIDVSKIKVGDEVTVRAKVLDTRLTSNPSWPVVVTIKASVGPIYIAGDEIATHTPAPRDFKPGDIVFWNGNENHHWSLEAQADGFAFLKYVRCLSTDDYFMPRAENRKPIAVPIGELRHAVSEP